MPGFAMTICTWHLEEIATEKTRDSHGIDAQPELHHNQRVFLL